MIIIIRKVVLTKLSFFVMNKTAKYDRNTLGSLVSNQDDFNSFLSSRLKFTFSSTSCISVPPTLKSCIDFNEFTTSTLSIAEEKTLSE